jgi:protein-disulfide isomerase
MKSMKVMFLSTVAAAVLLSGCSGGGDATANSTDNGQTANAGTAVTPPAGTEWSATVVKTPENGFKMGNPDAKVKLIEYGAMSCSHCAEFSEASKDGLKALVNTGNVSYEFRNFLLNVMDVPASLLVRCGGPAPFFQIAEQMFADQRTWLGRTQAITQADQQAMSTMTPTQTAQMLASKLELDKFVQQRGVPSAKVQACLSDPKAIDELGKISEVGQKEFQITGTPTFIINGQVVKDANTWEKIEPMLKAAGA